MKFSYAIVNDADADEAIYDTLARLADVPGEKFHKQARKKLGITAGTLKGELRRRRAELAAEEAEARAKPASDRSDIEEPVIVRFSPPYSACEWPSSHARALYYEKETLTGAVGVPVFAAGYLAPLRELFQAGTRPKLTIFLYGPTGTLKTSYSVMAMAHYGPFTDDSLPASFSATANALEKIAFLAKDVLFAVDDYHPASNPLEERKMADSIQRLLRGVGNSSGRGRMNPDGTLRPEYRPRCVGLISGERLPAGASTLSRAFIVPIEHGSIRKDDLSEAQGSAGMLPIAMGGYVQSVAQRWDELVERLPERFRETRLELQGSGLHLRQPEQVAHLLLGLETFLDFAVERKAIDIASRDKRMAEARDTLSALACEHAAVLREDDPVSLFLALLHDGIAAQRIFLEAETGDAPTDATAWGWSLFEVRSELGKVEMQVRRPPNGRRVGFVDEDWVYLIPEEAHRFAVEAARGSDRLFPVESKTLWRRLDEAGLIHCKDEPRHGRRRVIDRHIAALGKTMRVVMFTRDAFSGGPPLSSGTGDSGDSGKKPTAEPHPSHPNHPSGAVGEGDGDSGTKRQSSVNGEPLDGILTDCRELDITLKLQGGKLAYIGAPPPIIAKRIKDNMAALIAWLEQHGGEFPLKEGTGCA